MDKFLMKGGKRTADKSQEDCEPKIQKRDMPIASTHAGSQSVAPENSSSKRRYYQAEYLKFGFHFCGDESNQLPLCLICEQKLSNNSMKPSLIKRHLETVHPGFKDKPLTYFEEKKKIYLNKSKVMTSTFTTVHKELLQASLKVSYRIAQQGEAHSIGENLIKPCVIDICETIFGPKELTKVKQLALSNDTVKRRILHCANNLLSELLQRLKLSPYFTLQLDESTDVSGLAVLLVFVRYQYKDELCEDLLMCDDLKSTTTGFDIFKKMDDFNQLHDIDWKKCIDICTDGAKAMQGTVSGVVARIKEVAHASCSSSHCILHRESLAIQNIPESLKDIFNALVKLVNFIKNSDLNIRLFRQICTDMGSDYDCLLFYTEVRWLSRGKVVRRIFELRSEVVAFLNQRKSEAQKKTTKEKIQNHIDFMASDYNLQGVAYLCDILDKLNELNLSLQGKNTTIFTANAKISSFKTKITMWKERAKAEEFDTFENFSSYLLEKKTAVDVDLKKAIIQHLEELTTSFNKYFPNDIEENDMWIVNPFSTSTKRNNSGLSTKEEEELIDISFDTTYKEMFSTVSLSSFWAGLLKTYPNIADKAVRKLLPFVTTYLCECGFAKYCDTKTKKRNRLDASADIRCQLTSWEPNFEKIAETLSQQISH